MLSFFSSLSLVPAATLAVLLFFLGAIFGSYMDVVRSRRSWRRSLTGRSRCAACSRTLSFRHLIPVWSYLAAHGRCSFCSRPIPRAHLAAELVTGSLFVLAVFGGSSLFVAGAVMLSALFVVPIVIADIESMEVPEHLSRPFALLTFTVAASLSWSFWSAVPLLSGFLFALPFALLWSLSGGRAMGLGDAKVAISFGFLLAEPVSVLSAFFLSFWVGTVGIGILALSRMLRGKPHGLSRGLHVPFVPCIAIAFFFVLITDSSLFTGLDILFS